MPIIFAHSTGYTWDEFIPLGIAIIFTLLMAIGWWRSRSFKPEEENEEEL